MKLSSPKKESFLLSCAKVCRSNYVLESCFWLGSSPKPYTRIYLWNEGGGRHRDSAQEPEPWEGRSVVYLPTLLCACVQLILKFYGFCCKKIPGSVDFK